MSELHKKYFCPRLLDYIVITGSRNPNNNNNVAQTPELLRRYPLEDHKDFPLPTDVIFFCQPEGCISVGPKRMSLRETTSFVFTLTEKDSGIVRYGICVNFFRPFEKRSHNTSADWQNKERNSSLASTHSVDTVSSTESDKPKSPRARRKGGPSCRVRNNTLTSLCIVSHHPFFSTFRECLFILRRLIDACHDRSCVRRIGGSKGVTRDTVWGVLTGQCSDNITSLVMHDVREIETWILRLLSAPVPVPGKTRVEVHILPKDLQAPLLFALPDNTRFTLIDFPLHLPLELLGVDTCLKVLTAVMLEHKVILQSRDYNALSMSVMAFVYMLYPLEYMFPVIPLLPTCMSSAEQLLSAPTPYLIGVPASFFLYKKGFVLPEDIWIVDLDSNKIHPPTKAEPLPSLPDPEGAVLKTHLKQALASMSMTPQPIKNLDALAQNAEIWQRRESFSSQTGFNPLIYGNDVDSVDVATRVAMIRFFNSSNILGNFCEHTRTLRLYPRPVVAFQLYSFLKSRQVRTHFSVRLARTQAVEYYAEWSLSPQNLVYLRVHTGVYDPSLIGDKPKWYAHQLQPVEFHVYDPNSSLGAALNSVSDVLSDEIPTDESGSDSEGAESTSSSYSSLSDFVTDMVNSEIDGETPAAFIPENQILAVDESKVFTPPDKLHVPDVNATNSDSALSLPEDSDVSSSASSSPTYSDNIPRSERDDKDMEDDTDGHIFRYDSGNVTATSVTPSRNENFTVDSPGPLEAPRSPKLPSFTKSTNSAFDVYEKPKPLLALIPPNPNMMRAQRGSVSSSSSTSTTKGNLRVPNISDHDSDRSSSPSSIISTISNELTDMAQSATHTMSELFGNKQNSGNSSNVSNKPQSKPFTPLGNRKASVEKSGLVKQSSIGKKPKEPSPKPSQTDSRSTSNSENQQFLKDLVNNVMEGQGTSWLKMGRVKTLMEDENYRNFVVSRLNKNLDKKVTDESLHIDDVCVSRQVFKGMLAMLKAIIHGLERTFQNHGLGGTASAYMVLEIAHTHYWYREPALYKSETNLTPDVPPFHGSHDSLTSRDEYCQSMISDAKSLHDDNYITGSKQSDWPLGRERPSPPGAPSNEPLHELSTPSPSTESGSPVIVNGDEYENIEIHPDVNLTMRSLDNVPGSRQDQNRNVHKHSCDIIVTDHDIPSANTRSGDMLHEMVKNKELIKASRLDKISSVDSEMSDASTLVSTCSDDERKKTRINHHSIKSSMSDSEADPSGNLAKHNKRNRSPSLWSNKSSASTGYRYREGKLISTSTTSNNETGRTFLFEGLLGKERSRLWDQMQFWEDVFLDAVAQERDIIGMDQSPSEMMDRYASLGDMERKRLEHDEDKILSTILFNLVSFMIMLRVNKTEIKKKSRRLLGKSHIGLIHSQEVNNLLDQISMLHGNDIDLKPICSRQMQKQSFTVHWGTDNTGDMLFMEVCDDCLLLRSVTGSIHDRWWFEKLVNMTYCPKTKVLCLWRKNGEKVQLNQFYTKKCKELYFCVKEAMEKAAARNSGKLPGPELGGEFPVQDLKSGQGGLLQVCMEGIGLLLANSKEILPFFIELAHIRKCFTLKGGIFVLEEFDTKNKKIIQHKFKSGMANEAVLMIHRIFAVKWAKQQKIQKTIFPDENGNSMQAN